MTSPPRPRCGGRSAATSLRRPIRPCGIAGTLPLLAGLLLVLGCDSDGESGGGVPFQMDDRPSTTAPLVDREYVRRIVYASTTSDTGVVVPFSFRAQPHAEGVTRRIRGSIAREGSWEVFTEDRWETAPTRTPWRIHPRGEARLVVGAEDEIEAIVFDEGSRRGLELSLGEEMAGWSGSSGETFRLLGGSLSLPEGTVPGVVLDVSSAVGPDDPRGGDVGVLVSGDTLVVVVDEPGPGSDPPGRQEYRGWALLAGREIRLDSIAVQWSRRRSFDPARRDVPVEWTLTAGGSTPFRGRLVVRASELEAGEGEGPVLPVEGLFHVRGTVVLDGRSFTVHGFLRHAQR